MGAYRVFREWLCIAAAVLLLGNAAVAAPAEDEIVVPSVPPGLPTTEGDESGSVSQGVGFRVQILYPASDFPSVPGGFPILDLVLQR